MSYEQFKVFWIMVKNWKIMVDYHKRNGSKNYLTKKSSQPRRNYVVFWKKNVIKKISAAKTWKILKVEKWR